jgi:DNA-binding HxlR family transcriptional regulator
MNETAKPSEQHANLPRTRVLDQGVSGTVAIEAGQCPVRDVLDGLGDTATLLVLLALVDGPRRFGTLQRTVPGLSKRMLTEALEPLERNGLVSRTVRPTTPPAMEYVLTDLGRSAVPPVAALVGWAWDKGPEVMAARQLHNGRNA